MKQVVQRAKARWKRWSRAVRITLVVLILLLVGARLAMPFAVHRYVNYTLDQLPDYDGRIGDVDIHLFRGAYSINHVDIVKTEGRVPVPFFSAPKVDFSIQWRELFSGALVGEVEVFGGKLNFVKAATREESQTSIDRSWLGIVKDLFPFKSNRFAIHNGEIWFRDFSSNPKVDLFLTNAVAVATNLTNARNLPDRFPAGFTARGLTLGGGELKIQMRLNPRELGGVHRNCLDRWKV